MFTLSALQRGRGRGGILEHLMKTGVRPGVPQGRGIAPPDWGKFLWYLNNSSESCTIFLCL